MATKFNKIYRKVIAQMNDNIMTQMGFGKEVEDVHNGICPSCQSPVDPTSFRDELSQREFKISGLCQKCQDEIFGTEEDYQDEDMYTDEEDYSGAIPEEPEDFRDDDIYNATDIEEDYQDEQYDENTIECQCCYEPMYSDDSHICYDTETRDQLEVCQACYDGLISSGKAVPSESDLD